MTIPDDDEVLQIYEEKRRRSSDSASVVALLAAAYGVSPELIRSSLLRALEGKVPKTDDASQPTSSQPGHSSLSYPPGWGRGPTPLRPPTEPQISREGISQLVRPASTTSLIPLLMSTPLSNSAPAPSPQFDGFGTLSDWVRARA